MEGELWGQLCGVRQGLRGGLLLRGSSHSSSRGQHCPPETVQVAKGMSSVRAHPEERGPQGAACIPQQVGRCHPGDSTPPWCLLPRTPLLHGPKRPPPRSPTSALRGRPAGGQQGSAPEKRSQSSPRRLSGMPFSTSSRILAVRYMHTPRPNSKKWMFHDSSFIFSLAWGEAAGSLGVWPR